MRRSGADRAPGVASGRLVLGLSGGMDSMVLLDLLSALRAARSASSSAALHVNHQLSPHAGQWSALCAQRSRDYGVPFRAVRVEVERDSPEGLEAAARDARYAVFEAQDADAVVLAHHLDDQAETLLLQLLRGAGPRGLAAMPAGTADRRDRPAAAGAPAAGSGTRPHRALRAPSRLDLGRRREQRRSRIATATICDTKSCRACRHAFPATARPGCARAATSPT